MRDYFSDARASEVIQQNEILRYRVNELQAEIEVLNKLKNHYYMQFKRANRPLELMRAELEGIEATDELHDEFRRGFRYGIAVLERGRDAELRGHYGADANDSSV